MPRLVHRISVPPVVKSLWPLFLLRTFISLSLVGAGIACLYFGHSMLLQGLQLGSEALLVEIPGKVRITAGGFGAVVMAASLVPFLFAYASRPTLKLVPVGRLFLGLLSSNVRPHVAPA